MKIRNELGVCTHCGEKKPLTEFSKDKRSAYGLRPECKNCEHRRGSYYIKSIRFRLKRHPKWYGNVKLLVTSADINAMPNVCYFCKEGIEDAMSIHRLNHGGDYSVDNIVKVHKTCHAKHGDHNKQPNPKKGFGSMDKEKLKMLQRKAMESRWGHK